MTKGKLKLRIPNPHQKNDIDVSLVKEMMRQAEINNEDWDNA